MENMHPLHHYIGTGELSDEFLETIGCEAWRDTACGGDSRISLFCSEDKGNEARLTDVDLLIIKDGLIRVIIEIEESDIGPNNICGKVMTAAMCPYHLPPGPVCYEVSRALFIQVCGIDKLGERTKKIGQFPVIEEKVNVFLSRMNSRITDYRLLWGTMDDFKRGSDYEVREAVFDFIMNEA